MIGSLPLFHKVSGLPVIVIGEGDAGEAKRRLVERAGAVVVGEAHDAARLAFVALANPDATAARLKARGLLVNVTDRPDLCDFTVPSVLERGPVLIAVGTSGVSAGLAKALRLRLEMLLPASLGALAEALGGARARLRTRLPDAAERRRALDAALSPGGALDPLGDTPAEQVEAWLAQTARQGGCPPYEIRLRSQDPDDLSLREARMLGTADVVAHDPGIAEAILVRARADARRIILTDEMRLTDQCGAVVVLRKPQ